MRESACWAKSYLKSLIKKESSWKIGPDPEQIFLKEVEKHLEKAKTLLDIGCGVGRTVKLLASEVREAWGLDVSRRLIEVARRNAPTNAHFKVAGSIQTSDDHQTRPERYTWMSLLILPAMFATFACSGARPITPGPGGAKFATLSIYSNAFMLVTLS